MVTVRDVFKAAVCLAGSFLAVAAIYFLLQAEFIGVVQILVYVGAVSILIAFAVMIISNVSEGSRPARGRIAAATIAAPGPRSRRLHCLQHVVERHKRHQR